MKGKPHYSGNHSKKFWAMVGTIKDDSDHRAAYFAGVLLQELEGRVLRFIENCTPSPRRRRAERKSK